MNELKARALQLLRASADAPSATSPRAGAGDDPSTPSSSSKKGTPSKQGAKKRTPGGGTPVTPATVGSTPGTPGGTGGSGRKGKGRARFAEFWPRDVVREGLREQHLHEGKIRVLGADQLGELPERGDGRGHSPGPEAAEASGIPVLT